ncbi:hypothetical protein L7F22_053701 [Adiantum nelumboides]|nr:hypothetical protein [Adiantum nelumboides]
MTQTVMSRRVRGLEGSSVSHETSHVEEEVHNARYQRSLRGDVARQWSTYFRSKLSHVPCTRQVDNDTFQLPGGISSYDGTRDLQQQLQFVDGGSDRRQCTLLHLNLTRRYRRDRARERATMMRQQCQRDRGYCHASAQNEQQTIYVHDDSLGGVNCILHCYPHIQMVHPLMLPLVYSSIHVDDMGNMTCSCDFCGAHLWQREVRDGAMQSIGKYCCRQGKISLFPLASPPDLFAKLLSNNDSLSRGFKKNIRSYNSVMAFASLGANIDNSLMGTSGAYCFRVHGSLYHRVGSLVPHNAGPPKFAQMYVYDTDHEVQNRMNALEGLDVSTLQALSIMMRSCNPYANAFYNVGRLLRDTPNAEIRMTICENRSSSRQYLIAVGNEVAAIMPGQGDLRMSGQRDIVLHYQDGRLQRISNLHRSYMPLLYVLLFPRGEDGWHLKLPYADVDVPTDALTNRQFLDAVAIGRGSIFFLDGPVGTGKTYLYNCLLSRVRGEGAIALATASSGISALLLKNGRTAHSRFKIPLDVDNCSTCNIPMQGHLAELIRVCKLIVWDEAPMTNRNAFEAFDRTLQDIMCSHKFFGGKVLLLGGDFRQILPVVPKGSRSDIVNATLCCSYLWPQVTVLRLFDNMRMRGDDIADIAYRKWLMDVGNGTLTSHEDHTMAIPSDMVLSNQSMDGLISYVYLDMNRHLGDAIYFRDRAILAPRNSDVDIVNAKTLCAMSGDIVEYFRADSIIEDSMQQSFLYSVEFLNGLNLGGGFPVHYLQLKLNAPIILLRNLDPSRGLCNGTRLVCKAFHQRVLKAEIVTRTCVGTRVFIPRICFIYSDSVMEDFPCISEVSFLLTMDDFILFERPYFWCAPLSYEAIMAILQKHHRNRMLPSIDCFKLWVIAYSSDEEYGIYTIRKECVSSEPQDSIKWFTKYDGYTVPNDWVFLQSSRFTELIYQISLPMQLAHMSLPYVATKSREEYRRGRARMVINMDLEALQHCPSPPDETSTLFP